MPAVEFLAAGTGLLELHTESRYVSRRGRQRPAWEMTVESDFSQESGRLTIIKLPRLTRLLDETEARIIMLVAPAGYGKTTLAREWLDERPHAWYRGTEATADVAALAASLADAAGSIVPGAGVRMGERMRATGTPEQDVEPLAELLAEDLSAWPADAWLVIDDYHFALDSQASERFVDLLLALSPIRLFLTTRARPRWATARRLLYGEIYELGRNLLAMSQDEATEILSHRRETEAGGLVALAEGWPAVIGLAALTDDFDLPEGSLPDALYDYLAEELYQAARPEAKWGLCRLALAPSMMAELADFLLGAEAPDIVGEGLRLGVLTAPAKGALDVHPLLRAFLEAKFREFPEAEVDEDVARIVRFLIAR